MARTRRTSGRGTRFSSGYIDTGDGYPIANPSGGKICVSGVSTWAGTTVTLVTGLSTIDNIVGTVMISSSSTIPLEIVFKNINNNSGCASAALYYSVGDAGQYLFTSTGCSIAFIAFGS